MKYKYVLMNLSICPHICLDKKIDDNFEFEINWQKPYITNMEWWWTLWISTGITTVPHQSEHPPTHTGMSKNN